MCINMPTLAFQLPHLYPVSINLVWKPDILKEFSTALVFAQKIISTGKSHFTPLRIIEGWSIVNVHNCLPLTIRIRKHWTSGVMVKPRVELMKSS